MEFYFYISKLFTPILVPSNFLILGSIIFFYLSLVKRKLIYKKIFIFFFSIFSIFSIFPIGKNLFYFFYEKDYYQQKIPKNIDFIFVPSGGEDRLIAAINIKNKNNLKNTKILYSSGNAYLDKKNAVDQEKNIIEIIIENSKIISEDLVILPEARNTLENFSRLNEYLEKNEKKDKTILLVTHAYHIKRCLYISKSYNLNIFPYPSSFTTKNTSSGFINNYQKICALCNLRFVDLLTKETLSLFIVKLFWN